MGGSLVIECGCFSLCIKDTFFFSIRVPINNCVNVVVLKTQIQDSQPYSIAA